jgi:hypothetical protein
MTATDKKIGSRETATITNPIHPTWGTATEVCKWEYTTDDGIRVSLETYAPYSGATTSNITMTVMHTDSKGWNTGNHGSATTLSSAKRWITRTIRETRAALSNRATA